ncbi:MAG TPA: helix-turn-helix transcriptional regulator [Gemmatimonadales bacterium]|jgi:AraC-type DNA-binding domain-containing proteins
MPQPAFRFDLSVYSPGCSQRPHAHDDLSLSIALRGAVAEQACDAVEHGQALSAVVKDPGVTHANEFGPTGALIARLTIDGRRFADLAGEPGDAPAWRWIHHPVAAAPFLRLVDRATRGEKAFAVDDNDVVDLLAAFSGRVRPGQGEPPRWLRLALEQLRDDDAGSLSVREVARSAGVHPVYLARAVRRWYGTTPAAELRSARIRRAAETLAQGTESATRIAHRHGFADQPHLCRVFGQATGVTPGLYRSLVARIQGDGRRTA